jgi:peptide/nickel transport system ATP-binding protein
MLLQIENLTIHFQTGSSTVKGIENISFSINKGEIVAVVGESGSGKSITSLAAMRLLPSPPAVYPSGKILFTKKNGETTDILSLSQSDMRHLRGNEIAMIFQEPMSSLNPVFTCGQQVMEAIQLHQKLSRTDAKQKTIALFEKVKLPNPSLIVHRYPHELSGGQKQRVMIAMAMSCNPSLLIADEPTTALDVTVQKTILELIKELQRETGMGVLFITHDLGVVKDIANKVVVMYRGSIPEQGSTNEIFTNPQHAYTKALLACRPGLYPKHQRLPVVSDFLDKENKDEAVKHTQPAVNDTTKEQPAPNPELLLSVQHVNVWFPAKKKLIGKPSSYIKAVNDVSFEVYKGETLGLVGESGCGKTTLGRTILRLIPPTSGKVLLYNKDILALPSASFQQYRKDLQIVFQDPFSSLNPRITIGSAIAEPMMVHNQAANAKQAKEKVIELLEKVSLPADYYKRYPHEFSGGQRQRIVIARALALHPSFIVWDESVSALDVSVQAQVLNLLNDLKKEFGFTSIFISHDLSVVRYICDRMIVINKGQVEESGTVDEIYFNPKKEYTRMLLDAIPGKKGAIR